MNRCFLQSVLAYACLTTTLWAAPNRPIHFDGTNDYIALRSGENLGADTVRTIEAWVKPSSCKGSTNNFPYTSIYADHRTMLYCQDNRLAFQAMLTSPNRWPTIASNEVVMPNGEWTHIAVTLTDEDYEGSPALRIRLYVNGYIIQTGGWETVENDGSSRLMDGVPAASENLYLGRKESSHFWHGALDEVRLWSDVRTANEILDNRDKTLFDRVGRDDGLLAVYAGDWIFDDAVKGGTVERFGAIEYFTSSRDGTLTNFHDWPSSPVEPLVLDWRQRPIRNDDTNPQSGSHFGFAVAKDGDLSVIGAPEAQTGLGATPTEKKGAVLVHQRAGRTYSSTRLLGPTVNSEFGYSVAVDDDKVLVGSPGWNQERGSAQLYQYRPNGVFDPITITDGNGAANHRLGTHVALNGHQVALTAPGANRAYTCTRSGNTCNLMALPNLPSGTPTAIDMADNYLALGATGTNGRGEVHIYEYDGSTGNWVYDTALTSGSLEANHGFGQALSFSRNRLAVGAPNLGVEGEPNAGAVYVYERNAAGTWSSLGSRIVLSNPSGNDHFGSSLAIDYRRLVIVADDLNAGVHVYQDDSGSGDWVHTAHLTSSIEQTTNADELNQLLALDDEEILFGRPFATVDDFTNAGAISSFESVQPVRDMWLSSATVAEDAAENTVIGTLSALDVSREETINYTVVSAHSPFSILGDKLVVGPNGGLDFETSTEINVQVRVTDSTGALHNEDFTISVTDASDAPRFATDPVTGAVEDSQYIYSIIGDDDDTPMNSLSFAGIGHMPDWLSLIDQGDGTATLVGTPRNADVGELAVTLEISDGVLTAQQSFRITVTNSNDPPSFSMSAPAGAVEDIDYSYGLTTADPDIGDTRTITAPTLPAWLTLMDNGDGTGQIFGIPRNNDVGIHNIVLTVTDAVGAHTSIGFQITVVNTNDPPTFTSTALTNVDEDEAYLYAIATDDPDVGDTATILATSIPNWLSFTDNGNGTGTLSGTPRNLHVGPHTVTLLVTDSANATAGQTFTITVKNTNDAPVFTSAPIEAAEEDSAYLYAVRAEDEDIGDSLNISAITLPPWLTLSDNGDGTASLSGTPGNDDIGDNGVVLKVVDSHGQSNTQSFAVSVNNTNDPPFWISSGVENSTEDEIYIYVMEGDDVDVGDQLTFTALAVPQWLNLTNAGNGEGRLTGTPTNDAVGDHDVVIELSDQAGASVIQRFTISVINVNDTPIANDGTGSGNEGGIVIATLRATDVDNDAADLTGFQFEIETQPAFSTAGIIILPGSIRHDGTAFLATAQYEHDGSETFQDSFTYRAFDGDGYSNIATVAVNVSPVNDPPIALHLPRNGVSDDLAMGEEGKAVEAILVATDSDTGPLGEPPVAVGEFRDVTTFSFEVVSLPQGVNPDTVTIGNTGYDESSGEFFAFVTYTHSGSEEPTDIIEYVAHDGMAQSEVKTVTIPITGVPDAPFIDAGSANFRMREDDGPAGIELKASDRDSEALRWVISTPPRHGTASLANAGIGAGDPRSQGGNKILVEYNPHRNFPQRAAEGYDSFSVQVFDPAEPQLKSAPLEVNVVVEQVNDAPKAIAGIPNASVVAGSPWSYTIYMGWTRYTRPAFNDVEDGLNLSFSAHTPNGGNHPFVGDALPNWLVFDEVTKTFTATPTDADVGVYPIRVVAYDSVARSQLGDLNNQDGMGSSDFLLTVETYNAPPSVISEIEVQHATQDREFTYATNQIIFTDPDHVDLEITVHCPLWMTTCLHDGGDYRFSGLPTNEHVGKNHVRIVAKDGRDAQVETSFEVHVANVNDRPFVARGPSDRCVMRGSRAALPVPMGGSNAAFSDPDLAVDPTESITLSLSADPALSWLSVDPTTNHIQGDVPDLEGLVGDHIIEIRATDAVGEFISDDFVLRIIESAIAAETGQPLESPSDQEVLQDVPFSFNIPDSVFLAVHEVRSDFVFRAHRWPLQNGPEDRLPTWMTFDPSNGTFTGTAGNDEVGIHSFGVTATNCAGTKITATFDVTVLNVNDPPVIRPPNGGVPGNDLEATGAIPDQYLEVGEPDEFSISNIFSDPDANDLLRFTVAGFRNDPEPGFGGPIPNWLTFDQETQTFSTQGPAESELGRSYLLQVTATDQDGASASTEFAITVIAQNDPPYFIGENLSALTAVEDQPFAYQIPGPGPDLGFDDPDLDDEPLESLRFQADIDGPDTHEQDWLSFDAETRTFSGIPRNRDVTLPGRPIQLSVVVTDIRNTSDHYTFDLTVENTNDGPTVVSGIDDQFIFEGRPYAYTIPLDGFQDIDRGDQIEIESVNSIDGQALPAWLTFDDETDTLSGLPDSNDLGMYTIEITATDGDATAFDIFTIIVLDSNDAPVLVAPCPDQVVDQDDDLLFAYPNDTFEPFSDDDVLTYSARLSDGEPLPEWLSFDPQTLIFSGVPSATDVAFWNIQITAFDLETDDGGSTSDFFVIEVRNVNDPPEITGGLDNQIAHEDLQFDFQMPIGLFTDPDGDVLVLSASLSDGSPLPPWLGFYPLQGHFRGTPRNSDVGVSMVRVFATDIDGAKAHADFSITVENTNDAPLLHHIGDQAVSMGETIAINIAFSDEDFGDNHQLGVTSCPDQVRASIQTHDDGRPYLFLIPAEGFEGSCEITVTVTDDGLPVAAAHETFMLIVTDTNDPPRLSPIAPQTLIGDEVRSVVVLFSDPNDDTHRVTMVPLIPDALQIERGGDSSGWTFQIQANEGFFGDVDVLVTVTDDGEPSLSSSHRFGVTVHQSNEPPQLDPLPDVTINEGTSTVLVVSYSDSNLLDQHILSFAFDDDALGIHGDGNKTGSVFNLRPVNDYVGETQVTATVTEARIGGLSHSVSFSVTVVNTNDPPRIAALRDLGITPVQSVEFQVVYIDPDQDDEHMVNVSTSDNRIQIEDLGDDRYRLTPLASFNGRARMTVRVTDNGDPSLEDETSFWLNVTADGNTPEILTPVDVVIREDESYTLAVEFSDADETDEHEVMVWVEGINATVLGNGSLSPASRTIQPGSDVFGNGIIRIQVTDQLGLRTEAEAALTVIPVNDAPMIEDQTFETLEEQSVSGQIRVIDMDSDTYEIEIINGPINGRWVWNPDRMGEFEYMPNADFYGKEVINLKAIDDAGAESNIASITITVAARNDAPLADDLEAVVNEDSEVTITLSATDIDDAVAFFQIQTPPMNGSLRHDVVGGISTYAPARDFFGADSFTYIAVDENGKASEPARVDIRVEPINDGPIIRWPLPESLIEAPAWGGTFTFNIEATDADEDPLTFAVAGLPTGATFNENTGRLDWALAERPLGEYPLVFVVSDGLLTDEVRLVIKVVDTLSDSDGDGIDDVLEWQHGLDPEDADSDDDFIDDRTEFGDGPSPIDTDGDEVIDALDLDSDNDTLLDTEEAGDNLLETPPRDTNEDGVGDWRSRDSDGDGILDGEDICPRIANESQSDSDGDGVGDVCDEGSLPVGGHHVVGGFAGDEEIGGRSSNGGMPAANGGGMLGVGGVEGLSGYQTDDGESAPDDAHQVDGGNTDGTHERGGDSVAGDSDGDNANFAGFNVMVMPWGGSGGQGGAGGQHDQFADTDLATEVAGEAQGGEDLDGTIPGGFGGANQDEDSVLEPTSSDRNPRVDDAVAGADLGMGRNGILPGSAESGCECDVAPDQGDLPWSVILMITLIMLFRPRRRKA